MDRDKAIELLKVAVPQDESLDEEGLFLEAINMAIAALEGKDTNVPTNDGKTLVVKIPKEYLDTTARVILDSDPWCKLFYEDAAPTALDHIHTVVKDEAYQRGYEQAKDEYDAKLEEVKSRFKEHYYNKGYEQGKADAEKELHDKFMRALPEPWEGK